MSRGGVQFLASIVSPGYVETIEDGAFPDIIRTQATIVLPAGDDYNDRKAVWVAAGFSSFRELPLPGQTEVPEKQASGFEYTLLDDYTVSVAWGGEDNQPAQVEIPAAGEIDGVPYRVSQVAPHGFEDKNFESVSIPSSVASIGEAAFQGCGSLTSVSLCEGLVSIEKDAFADSGVETLKLPASVAFVGERAFANCENLFRVVTMSEPDVDDTALAGCAGVSVYLPYCEDGAYSWNVGVMASGNHLMPYGLSLPDEPLRLAVGASADLFEGGLCEIPEGAELGYAYSATPLTVDAGTVTGKREGISEVEARLLLDGVELARASRSVEVEAASPEDASDSEKEAGQIRPPIASLLAPLNGFEQEGADQAVEPRANINVGPFTCGGCAWYIDTAGSLQIRKAPEGTGVLESFTSGAPWAAYASIITVVQFGSGVKAGGSISKMFYECSNLESIDFADFDTSSVTDMSSMFRDCSSLASLDLSGFSTSSVTLMSNMFVSCEALTDLKLPDGFIGPKVTYVTRLFSGCNSLATIPANLSFGNLSIPSDCFLYSGTGVLPTYYTGSDGKLLSYIWSTCNRRLDLVVTFEANGGTPVPASQNVQVGLRVIEPSKPSKAGSTFAGWYKDASCTQKYEFSSRVYAGGSLKLYAGYYNAPPAACGGCTWWIDPDGTLRIEKTPGGTGVLESFVGDAPWNSYATKITSGEFGNGVVAGSSLAGMFKGCANLESVYFADFDTSAATNMNYMFKDCSSLTSLDLSGFNTSSVTGMSQFFSGCSSLTALDLSSFVTASATLMDSMFYACRSLKTLDVSRFKTSSVTNMTYMFSGCTSLPSLSLANFDTASLESATNMFEGCSSLRTLDLSGFDTSSVQSLSSMFRQCESLTSLDLSDFDTSSIRYMQYVFSECRNLSDLKLPDGFIGPKVSSATGLFRYCNKLATIPSNLSFGNLDIPQGCFSIQESTPLLTRYAGSDPKLLTYNWAQDNRKLLKKFTVSFESNGGSPAPAKQAVWEDDLVAKPADPAKAGLAFGGWYKDAACTEAWDFAADVVRNDMTLYAGFFTVKPTLCGGCTWWIDPDGTLRIEKTPGGTGVLESFTSGAPWAAYATKITSVEFGSGVKAGASIGYMFSGCEKIESIGFSDFDTSSVTDMSYMLNCCSSLVSLDLSRLDTSSATDISGMFRFCSSLTSLDLSGFDTPSVRYMYETFKGCTSLADLTLPDGFIGPKTTTVAYLFSGCDSLSTIPANLAFGSLNIPEGAFSVSGSTPLPTRYAGSDTKLLTYNWAKDHRQLDLRVAFETNGGAPAPAVQTVSVGGLVSKPADPSKAGFTFAGWYKDAACTEAWDFAKDTVQRDTTLYAGYYIAPPAACGGCTWWIDPDGTLRIEKTPGGTGVLESFTSGAPWAAYATQITSVEFGSGVKAGASIEYMFSGCEKIESIGFSDFDTSSVTDMSYMLNRCSSLVSLDLSSFDTSSVTDMRYLFYGCSSLTALDLSSFNTASVTSMYYLFSYCSSLESLDVSQLRTSSVTDMGYMFYGCSALKALDISRFDTASVTGMVNMFGNCSSLADLKVFNRFITGSKVTSIDHLFSGCDSLSTIPANLAFGSLNIPEGAFSVSGSTPLPTRYAGSDKKLLTYNWAKDNRQLVAKYTVSFRCDGSSSGPADQTVFEGDVAKKPGDPAKKGYVFSGWYTDADLTAPYDFSLPITSNLVLYAKWTLVIAGTVPLEATFVVNASGDTEETACEITSTTVEPLKIVSIECIEEPGAKDVFPVDADRREIAVSLKPGAANAVSLAFDNVLQESSLGDFSLEANGRLSLALGLSLPKGIHIEPTGTDNDPDATKAVARLIYTVAPA